MKNNMSDNKLDFLQLLESSSCFDQNKSSIFNLIKKNQELEYKKIPGTDLHWMHGAADGAYLLHFKQDDDQFKAMEAFALFDTCIRIPSALTITKFYEYFFEKIFIDFEFPFRQWLAAKRPDLSPAEETCYIEKAALLGIWLIKHSPDIEQVKVGITIIGIFQVYLNESLDLIKELACNDEFTFFAIRALDLFAQNNSSLDLEKELMELSHAVNGWGRIFLVLELCEMPLNAATKKWFLREGFKNNVLYQYTAYACAVAGDLLEELKVPQPDEELLDGAAAILSALCESELEPMKNITHLPNGAGIVWLFLQHVSQRDLKPEYSETIRDIHNFLQTHPKDEENEMQQHGWTTYFCEKIKDLIKSIIKK